MSILLPTVNIDGAAAVGRVVMLRLLLKGLLLIVSGPGGARLTGVPAISMPLPE